MSSWTDLATFVATVSIVGGAVYAVIVVVQKINEGIASTKESLKERGLEVSGSGVSVKTSKNFNREDYFDATQRGVVRAVNAASFRKGSAPSSPLSNPSSPNAPHSVERQNSSASSKSTEEKKKKKLWGSAKKD